jgi:endonuclease III
MKRILLTVLIPSALLFISFSSAQTPDSNQEQRLLALVKDVQTQQAQMAENEKKIEEKLAQVTETIRTARIYTKREK